MRLGLMLGYSGAQLYIDVDLVQEAERLGYHSVWSAEAWGNDAATPLAWLAAQTTTIKLGTAIMQLPGRSPANTAMTAMSVDALSGGRFILGLGTSGPQVVEGWHGKPWYKPLTWMREYITVLRQVFARDAPLEFHGEWIDVPFTGEHSKRLGKPLKSILHGRRDMEIYTGSMAPKGQALSGELADGVLLTCMHPERMDLTTDNLSVGWARAGKSADGNGFDIVPTVACVIGDDLDAVRTPLKMNLGLYIGGMGARDKNFYKDYVSKVGFEAEAQRIQDLYLDGRRGDAMAAVTDEMVDTFHLCGPPEKIRDDFARWKESGVTTLLIGTVQREALQLLAELNA